MLPALALGLGTASGLTSLLGGAMGSNAAQRAARQQAAAMQDAIDFQRGVYSDAQQNYNPYLQSGKQNLDTYQNMLASSQQPTFGYQQQAFDFNKYKDPAAEYAMEQSGKAMEASALAKGATGGGFARALQQNQNNLANQAYQGSWNRYLDQSKLGYGIAEGAYNRDYTAQQNRLGQYANLANQGLTAAQGLAGMGQSAAGNMGTLYGNMGGAMAAGTLGSSNAMTGGLQGLMSGLGSGLGAYYGYGSGETNPYSSNGIKSYSKTGMGMN